MRHQVPPLVKLDLSGFSANWTGPSADIFALHFGGQGGGNKILLALSGDTSVFDFSMTGAQNGLSSIQGFGAGGVSQAPLPAALPLFAPGWVEWAFSPGRAENGKGLLRLRQPDQHFRSNLERPPARRSFFWFLVFALV